MYPDGVNVTLPPADYRAIRTRYVGATNYRSSRIIADAGDRQSRVTLEYDPALNPTDNHARAAVAVTEKMGWTIALSGGHFTSLVGGEYRDSHVWVFMPRGFVRSVEADA